MGRINQGLVSWQTRGMGLRERFEFRLIRIPETTCWYFDTIHSGGYAQMTVQGKKVRAHRVAYELFIGPIPNGRELDHTCRDRACVNPSHLEPVTHRENMQRSPLIPATMNYGKPIITCTCGNCPKCNQREYMREWRRKQHAA